MNLIVFLWLRFILLEMSCCSAILSLWFWHHLDVKFCCRLCLCHVSYFAPDWRWHPWSSRMSLGPAHGLINRWLAATWAQLFSSSVFLIPAPTHIDCHTLTECFRWFLPDSDSIRSKTCIFDKLWTFIPWVDIRIPKGYQNVCFSFGWSIPSISRRCPGCLIPCRGQGSDSGGPY